MALNAFSIVVVKGCQGSVHIFYALVHRVKSIEICDVLHRIKVGTSKEITLFFFSVTYIRFLSPSICLSSNMFVDVSSSQIPDRVNKNKMLH